MKFSTLRPLRLGARLCLALATPGMLLLACADDDDGGARPTDTGQACTAPEQCFPDVKEGELVGAAVCLDRVEGGYCTHECTQDSDCCAAAGECPFEHSEVCSPFESTDQMYCFLSCEDEDLELAGSTEGDAYCAQFANAAFHCRSSGGGSSNRKVCVP